MYFIPILLSLLSLAVDANVQQSAHVNKGLDVECIVAFDDNEQPVIERYHNVDTVFDSQGCVHFSYVSQDLRDTQLEKAFRRCFIFCRIQPERE